MTAAKGVSRLGGGNWAKECFIPSAHTHEAFRLLGPQGAMALASRVKALHHWMRKGDADRAARSARDAAHVANAALRKALAEAQ